MNKCFLLLSLFMLVPILMFGQPTEQVVQNFDTQLDTSYFLQEISTNGDSTKSYIHWGYETSNTKFGAGALSYDYSAQDIETYGGYAKIEHMEPDSQVFNWTGWDSISFWYNNVTPASISGDRIHLRFELYDVSNVDDTTSNANNMEFYYSFQYILDSEPGWNEFKIKLENTSAMDGTTFNRTGWAGIEGNNTLDLDKIKGYAFEVSISGSGGGDIAAGKLLLDHIALKGYGGKSLVIFDGRNVPPAINAGKFTWGQAGLDVLEGGGEDPKTNALRFTEGDEYGNGWSGVGFNLPVTDLSNEWSKDSLKFKMKTEVGTGDLRVQFEDGTAKVGKTFSADPDDGGWHEYVFALKDFVYEDGTSNFDSTAITVFGIMAEESGVAGREVLFDYIWTDNPVIDVTPSDPPTNVSGIPNTSEYYNVAVWQDVDGEEGETYNVYASESVISDVTAPGVETVAVGVEEGVQEAKHLLRYPLKDKSIKYYYAVTCVDAAGNESAPGIDESGATNTALGVPTISMNPPTDFVADGDVSEWIDAGIDPVVLTPSTSKIATGTFDNDKDFTANIYMAVDDDYLYIALDMIDNVYSVNGGSVNWYDDDAAEMFIGLYNMTTQHTGFKRGEEPDYQLQLRYNGFYGGTPNLGQLYTTDDVNYAFVNYIGGYWCTELKFSLDSLADASGDNRFMPANGMRIPLDFSLHDSDQPGVRDGVLAFSEANDDNSWEGPQNWFYMWIGDTNKVTTGIENGKKGQPNMFALYQNYPNPFNPSTTIEYSLAKAAKVDLSIYNVLGQKVATLVNSRQSAGIQQVVFDASKLSTGVYFYRIQADDFVQVKKMLLMK